jgi:hypothetical protein
MGGTACGQADQTRPHLAGVLHHQTHKDVVHGKIVATILCAPSKGITVVLSLQKHHFNKTH